MGKFEQPDELSARWADLTRERSLEDVPYKIELNAWGKLEMSPLRIDTGCCRVA